MKREDGNNKLVNRIKELEKENERLKDILTRYNIPINDDVTDNDDSKDISIVITEDKLSNSILNRYYSYFWGRKDVFAKYALNKETKKGAYYPQCDNLWKANICPRAEKKKQKCTECLNKKWTPLTINDIKNHILGKLENRRDSIGVYPIFKNGNCRFIVFDFDNHSDLGDKALSENPKEWIKEIEILKSICRNNKIPFLIERSRSGKGIHLWIFFSEETPADVARKFGNLLLQKGEESVSFTSFSYYDRMIPAQDYVKNGGLGNLIALPLQGKALKEGNSAFVDDNWLPYKDQFKALFSTKKMTKEEVEEKINLWDKKPKIFNDGDRRIRPWEIENLFNKSDIEGTLSITEANLLYIDTENIKPRMQNQIRRLALFSNPQFYKNRAMGLSNYNEPRNIYLGADDSGYICLPRGLKEKLLEKCDVSGVEYKIDDKRSHGKEIDVSFNGKLQKEQEIAVETLTIYDNGILSAATAFGKTVVCCNIIAKKRTSTLILLESTALIDQWKESIERFLYINEEIPEYITKTGIVKKRKEIVGIIHGAKDTSTGIIDIAMVGSLSKDDTFHHRLKEYGLVIVDECHHSASKTMSTILREVKARYIYGVTATPMRGDGLEKVNFMLLGSIRYQYTAKEKAEASGIEHLVVPRFTRVVAPHGVDKLGINEGYQLLKNNELRNQLIIEDIKSCVEKGRTPVVLSKYVEHIEYLYSKCKDFADKVFLLTGNLSKNEQADIKAEMKEVKNSESMVLFATGQLIGEGFDFPRLDTLIMATPVSWKGIVEQYAGRLNRDYETKTDVFIYDYIDMHIPVFDNMYMKRLRAYKAIGYSIYSEKIKEKQELNAIYSSDTYQKVFDKDLTEANRDIVISSPILSLSKVTRIIDVLKDTQRKGVKVTVVTWHPDKYKYGKYENKLEMLEILRNAGIHVLLIKEDGERYAVIDNEIVWYGSMNLLSKDDIDDNIMRIVDKKVAEELLLMTFKKGNEKDEYMLPI